MEAFVNKLVGEDSEAIQTYRAGIERIENMGYKSETKKQAAIQEVKEALIEQIKKSKRSKN